MAIHVTQIGKHKFVSGLFWQSLSRPRELVKEAGELAKKIDFDLVVLRKDHATAQAGFAQSSEGARRNSYSLGAAVSKTIAVEGADYDGQKQPAHNWLGAFKLPDGAWAYFAVRDANFLPNGDFAGTKDEVLDRLNSDYALGGWNVVIGDPELEELGFHNFNRKKIEDLIPRGSGGQIKPHAWWALRPAGASISWKPALVAGVVGLAVATTAAAGWRYHHIKELERQREFALEMARKRMNMAGPLDSHPWPLIPVPKVLAQACFDKFDYLTAGGWQLDDYTCSQDSTSYTWSRQDSTVDFLLAQVPTAVIDNTGNKASLVQPLRLKSGTDETLVEQNHLLERVLSKMQLMDLSMKINKSPPALQQQQRKPAAPGKEQEAFKPDWESYSFTLNAGALPPTDIASILNEPGIRLKKLSYHNGDWSFEGVMYAKLP